MLDMHIDVFVTYEMNYFSHSFKVQAILTFNLLGDIHFV